MTFAEQLPELNTRAAYELMQEHGFVKPTRFITDEFLSNRYNSEILYASELGQESGAYKERGAFNFFINNVAGTYIEEVVTMSAGNHAAAVARAARYFERTATIYMPLGTPLQKIDNVRNLGGNFVSIVLTGETVDEAAHAAMSYLSEKDASTTTFIHPFDDPDVVSGQGTLGEEILHQHHDVDVIVAPVGGGGLLSGIVHATKDRSTNNLHYIGVEPHGAASLSHNLMFDGPLPELDTYVDGAAVKHVGGIALKTIHALGPDNYHIIKPTRNEIRDAVTYFWQNDLNTDTSLNSRPTDLRPELAGALSVASLPYIPNFIRNKKTIFLLTGSNMSQERYEREVKRHNPDSAFAS